MIQQNIDLIILVLAGIALALLIWNTILQIFLFKMNKKQKKLFNGKQAIDLEKIIMENNQQINENNEKIEQLYKIAQQINKLASKGLHKTGMVRFNPFRDIGGDQSFSVAFLDAENSGLVVSSLYSRNSARVYAKSIIRGKSEKYPLTQEEKYVISIASSEKDNQKK